MASGTTGASSTYSEGKGFSFAKDIASRIVDAAESAKKEKKVQQKIIEEGGTVPEKDKKNLFVKALKQEFVSNPVNDLKKKFNKKIDKVGRVAGLFGSKGEKLQQKLSGKKLKIKSGFDRSGYQHADKPNDGGGAGGGTNSQLISSLGGIVLDIQQIASAVTSIQGLISTQMNMSVKMTDSLEQIKSALTEQVSLQQEQLSDDEMAAKESSLESSQQTSGSSKATSTFNDPALGGLDIFGMLGQLGDLFNILKSLPEMFGGLLKGLLSKIPGGKFILEKFGKKAVGSVAGEAVEVGAKGILGKILRPIFKRIPIIGGLIDFAVSLAMGEPVGRAAAKAAGSMLGTALGGILGSVVPGPGNFVGGLLGGIAGDWVGGSLYDAIAGAFGGNKDKEKKMAQGGGVMVADAGPELVTGLHSADAKKKLGGMNNKGIDAVQDTYYSALAGSTLAITKDFIEGLGPVGSAVAPVIQDEVSKLGRDFDLPATATKVSVGGMGLRGDPQAAKKGQSFLQDLVKGTLEKLTGKKDKDKKKKDSSGSSGSSSNSPTSNPTSTNQPTGGGKNDFTFGDSIASGLAGRHGANQQTVVDDKGVSKVGASPADVLGQLKSFDKTKLKDKVVRLSSGITNNPSDLKNVEEQIKYLVSVGAKVQLVGVTNTPPKTGSYKHLEKSLAGMNDKLKALTEKYKDKGVTFLGGFTPGSDGVHPANATELNTKFSVDVLPGGQVGAESGGKITLENSSGKPVTSWQTLEVHHPSEGPQEKYRSTPNSGKQNLAKDIVLTKDGSTNVGVPSPIDGTIGPASFTPGMIDYGPHFVEIVAGDQKVWIGHMKSASVKVGDKVKAGQILGVQGSMGQSTGPHVHIQGDKDVIKNWVSGMLSGNYTSAVSDSNNQNEEGNTETEEPDVDPFTAIENAVKGIVVGAALSKGNYKTKDEFEGAKKEYESRFTVPSAPANPATTTGTNPAATPNKPSTTPTSSTPPSTAGQPTASSIPAQTTSRPAAPTVIPTGAPTSPTESLSRIPSMPYSTGARYRPLTYAG